MPTANDYASELDRLRALVASANKTAPTANDFSTALAALNAKAAAAKPKPKPTANDWTTELDRLRAQGAAATKRPVAKPAQQEEPPRETYKPKPPKQITFGGDAYGNMWAEQDSVYQSARSLERIEARELGMSRQDYVRARMLPNVGNQQSIDSGIGAAISGVNTNTTHYRPDGVPFLMEAPASIPPIEKPTPRFDIEPPIIDLGLYPSSSETVQEFLERRGRELDMHPWVAMQPQPLNPIEKFIYSFLPNNSPFTNLALLQRYNMQSSVNPSINANLPKINGSVNDLFSAGGLANLVIQNYNNPDIYRLADEVVFGFANAKLLVESDAAKKVDSTEYAEKRAAMLQEIASGERFELLYQSYRDIGLEPGEARSMALWRAEKEIEANLQSLSVATSIYENGSNIVGAGMNALSVSYNGMYGGLEGGEAYRDAAFALVSTMVALGAWFDWEWRGAVRVGDGEDSRTLNEVGAQVREGVLNTFQALPRQEEVSDTGDVWKDTSAWVVVASGLTANRFMDGFNSTGSDIVAANASVIEGKYQLAIDELEVQRQEFVEWERQLRSAGNTKQADAMAQRIAVNTDQIATLKDSINNGIGAYTIDDLELRMQLNTNRVSAVMDVQSTIQEAQKLYDLAMSTVALTPEQSWARDIQLMEASRLFSSASEVLYESPTAIFERGYTPERFYFDMLAPTLLFDVGGKVVRWAGIIKSASGARFSKAAMESGVEDVLRSAETVTSGRMGILEDGIKAQDDAIVSVQKANVAIDDYAKKVAEQVGVDPATLAGKTVAELDEVLRTQSSFPTLGKELTKAQKLASRAEAKANNSIRKLTKARDEYLRQIDLQVEEMAALMDERIEKAAKAAGETLSTRPGRQSPLSTLVRRAQPAAAAVINDTHRALVDVFLHVTTKEDARAIIAAMKDPEAFFSGVNGQWSSHALLMSTNNGVDKLTFNPEPWQGKNSKRGLSVISKNVDEFLETLEKDILKGTGPLNKDVLLVAFDDLIKMGFARDTWVASAKAKLPFGTKSAKVVKGKTGAPKVQYIDENGTVIREIMATDAASAQKVADEVNAAARGEYFDTNPAVAVGDFKRKVLAVAFIGWNPANLIQQFMHPIINSLFQVDGGSVFSRGRLYSLSEVESHIAKLYGTENTTMRSTSTDFANVMGIGVNRTLAQKLTKPLGTLYTKVEEGMGKRFYYDAVTKFIQKYGKRVANEVLVPGFIEHGVDPIVAQKAGKVFYDVAYKDGFDAAAQAALDVIDGNVTRYTMSDFDPNWASWMHPETARSIEDVLNSSTSIADIDTRIAEVIAKFDEEISRFDNTTTPVADGTRHAFTAADTYQDVASLKVEMNRALNNAPPDVKAAIKADYKQVVQVIKQNEKLLQGLVAQMQNSNVPNVGNVFYHVWKAMRDGRTNIAMKADDIAEAIMLAGGKEKWATEYWPQVRQLWSDYYTDMRRVMSEAKDAIDSGDVSGLAKPEDLIVDHSRHTDDFLRNQLRINPGSGAYDPSMKVVMDAARAIERNQHSNFASVAKRSGAHPARIFDEAISAERDIAIRKVTIRSTLNALLDETLKEFNKTQDPKVWNEYFTQRNALWRNLFSDYVPARWMEATRNLLGNRGDALLNEIIATVGNVTPERAAEIANTIRTTLRADTLPPTRVVSPSAKMTNDAVKAVDRTALFDEIFPILDAAEGDDFVVRTAGGRTVAFTTADIDPINKKITVKGRSRDLSTIRMIEDANGNVLWDVDASPAWDAAQIKFKAGDDVIWRVNDTDTPVKIAGYLGEQNGVRYYSVEGRNTGIPENQIIRPKPTSQVPNVGTGGIQSSAPSVSPALAGIVNNAFGDGNTSGWFDSVVNLAPVKARNLLLASMDEFHSLHPDAASRGAIDELIAFTKEVYDYGNELYDAEGISRGENYFIKTLSSNPYDDADAPWFNLLNHEELADLSNILEKNFAELYGGNPTDTFTNISSPGLVVNVPQVNRANVAEKIAKSFGVPDEMADSFAQVVEAYATHVAEMWLEQADISKTRFATRDEYIDFMTDRWYEDSLIDIVHSGKGSGVWGAFDSSAQVEFVGKERSRGRLLVRVMDGLLSYSEEQRLRVAAHEFSHVFHNDLMRQAARGNKRASELITSLWENLHDDVYRPGQRLNWTSDSMEKFAVMFEGYIATGVAKVPALKPVFDMFTKWLEGTFAFYEGLKQWADQFVNKSQGRNIVYQVMDEILGGERANVPTLAERGINAAGEPITASSVATSPGVSRAPKTVPDVAYMNMIRKTAKDVFPELAEALKGIKNLKDVPPQLMPLVQQMADIYAMRKKLAIAKGAKDAAQMTDLEKAIDAATKVHSQYSPEFRQAIRNGNRLANQSVNTKAVSPNMSAMYSIEQLQNTRSKIVTDMRNRSHAAVRAGDSAARPRVPGMDVPAMPPEVKLQASNYMYNNFRNQWDKVLNGANKAGDAMRSFTMTDFWNRTRADDFLQLVSPFPFWSTRDIKNGFERMARNPGFIWHMYRIEQALDRGFAAYSRQQREEENRVTPDRYSNKWGMLGGAFDVPEWARGINVPSGKNGELVPIAALWPIGLSRFFPTNPVRAKDAMESGRNQSTGNTIADMFLAGSTMGLSFDPWINNYLNESRGQPTQNMVDWTVQSRIAAWTILRSVPPQHWNSVPSAARPTWFEYSVARELENMTQRGIITDRMTLGLAMEYLYAMRNDGKEFNSPEWRNATPEQQQAVWNALTAARDSATYKVMIQSGTGLMTGFPVYLYDTAEGRTNWEQNVRRGLYYDPVRNPLGTNEAANLYTTQSLPLQAADMQGKIIPKIETGGGWIPDNQETPRTPRPIVMASTSQRRERNLDLDKQIMDVTSKAVSDVLAKNPLATSSEMNAAKVEALLPMAREMLGDEAVDKWLAEQKKGLKSGQKVTYFGGLITLMRDKIAKETPSAYTERSNADKAPEGTPRRYMQDNLAHGSPFSTIPEKADVYNEALSRFPSPVNPDMLRNNHTVAAVELVVDLYKYPEYGSTKTGKEYAQKAQAADKQREEHLAKLLRITVEEARELLDQYKYRYMGEDEIARREQIEAQGYSGTGGRGYYPRRRYSSYRGGYSRGGYSRGTWGSGGSWGGGGSGDGTSETDLLPSIESYIRRREMAGYLWTRPRSKYAVR